MWFLPAKKSSKQQALSTSSENKQLFFIDIIMRSYGISGKRGPWGSHKNDMKIKFSKLIEVVEKIWPYWNCKSNVDGTDLLSLKPVCFEVFALCWIVQFSLLMNSKLKTLQFFDWNSFILNRVINQFTNWYPIFSINLSTIHYLASIKIWL